MADILLSFFYVFWVDLKKFIEPNKMYFLHEKAFYLSAFRVIISCLPKGNEPRQY